MTIIETVYDTLSVTDIVAIVATIVAILSGAVTSITSFNISVNGMAVVMPRVPRAALYVILAVGTVVIGVLSWYVTYLVYQEWPTMTAVLLCLGASFNVIVMVTGGGHSVSAWMGDRVWRIMSRG